MNEIDTLQGQIADHSVPVAALLQKALVLATRLGDEQFAAWARQEMNGYSESDDKAEYRCLNGRYVVLTNDGRVVPIYWQKSASEMNSRFATASLGELESLFAPDDSRCILTIHVDPKALTSLELEPGDRVGFEIGHSTLAGLLQAIRNRILDWTLSLPTVKALEYNSGTATSDNEPAMENTDMNGKQAILEQLDGLIQEGNRLNSSYRMRDMGQLESDLPESDFRSFATATLAAVARIARRDSEYHHSLPLVDASDPLTLPGYNNTKIPAMVGVLTSLRQAVDKGFLTSLETQVRDSIQDNLQRAKDNEATMTTDKRKVFVVFGRNNAARDAMFTFLRAIGLHPLEWSEIVKETGEASPYVGEVLKVGFSIVQAVVVLLTPDDEARLRQPYRIADDPKDETELTPQPRPNVLLEAGMALGLFPSRTVIVEMGRLRPISDIHGRHVIRLDNSPQKRQAFAQRLETAGCAVNLNGTDWLTSGSFDVAIGDCSSVATEPVDSVGTTADVLARYNLSEEARKLLVVAAPGDGQVTNNSNMRDGRTISANGRVLNEPGNPRSEAVWKQALEDLVDRGLLKDRGYKGEVFMVTGKGYEVADVLQKQEGA